MAFGAKKKIEKLNQKIKLLDRDIDNKTSRNEKYFVKNIMKIYNLDENKKNDIKLVKKISINLQMILRPQLTKLKIKKIKEKLIIYIN